jgi:hypothetical protein
MYYITITDVLNPEDESILIPAGQVFDPIGFSVTCEELRETYGIDNVAVRVCLTARAMAHFVIGNYGDVVGDR